LLLWFQIDLNLPSNGMMLGITTSGQRGILAFALDGFHWIV
jgi:hypothetical protein